MNAAIAQHLNVAEQAIIEIQEWASVLWVRVKGLGARFVSKKVTKVETVTHENRFRKIEMKPVSKAVMEVYKNGEFFKKMDITPFALTQLDIPASQQGTIIFDLNQLSGKGNAPKNAATTVACSSAKSRLNPAWVAFNNINNEGGEGYNPYPKYI